MRKSNFALRLQPSLMEELRRVAAEEGVAINLYVNVAVAEKLATRRAARLFFQARGKGGSAKRALAILRKAES